MSKQKPDLVWHYTTGQKIPLIQFHGMIRKSKILCGKERAAVWFSSNPLWEKTAAQRLYNSLTGERRLLRTMEEHVEYCGGLFRIGVSPQSAPHDWNAFRRLSGILPKHANGLRDIGYEWGSRISEWFVSFEPVPQSQWLSIEKWENDAWQQCAATCANEAMAA